MTIKTSNSNPWNYNGTYTIKEIANNWINPQQQVNLSNFVVKGDEPEGLYKIEPDKFDSIIVDGTYNRAVEHFYYNTLYKNIARRNGYSYASASGIIAFLRPDGKIVIVAGVHRCTFCVIKKVPIFLELHKHTDGYSLKQMQKIEAEVYTDEGYHLSKQTSDQALKAAYVAQEQWAVDFASVLSRMSMRVKTLGDQKEKALKLHGHKAIIDTIQKIGEDSFISASKFVNDEFEDDVKVEANFLAGLAMLLNFDSSVDKKYITKAVSTANILSDGFIGNLPHGSAKETLALRFAHLYNISGAKKKGFKVLNLLGFAKKLKMKANHIQFDSFMAGTGLSEIV